MGLIYPDNANRANRVEQLAVNIGSVQSEANDSLDRVDQAVKHQLQSVDEILKLSGFTSVEELNEKIQSLMTPEQRAAYEEQVKNVRGHDATTDKILESVTTMSFITGIIGLSSFPIARVLGTGALVAGIDLFGRGFRLMLKGDEAGIAMMRAAFRTFRALRIGGEVSETASQITRLVRTAAAVLSVLGVVLDGILLIYAAIEGAKQKEELQKGIRELSARRFQAKMLEDQLFATEAYCSQVSAFLITYNSLKKNGATDEMIKSVMDTMLSTVVTNLTEDLKNITDDKVWGQVADIDKQSSTAWTNEDPSHAWVKTWIESQDPLEPEQETSAVAKKMLFKMEAHIPNKGEAHIS